MTIYVFPPKQVPCTTPGCTNLMKARGANKRYCDDCLRRRENERKTSDYYTHRTPRFCVACGCELPIWKRKYCDGCRRTEWNAYVNRRRKAEREQRVRAKLIALQAAVRAARS